MAKDTEAVTVARLSARQAIVIALITAVAGVVTVVLSSRGKVGTPAVQHWLRIEGIEARRTTPIRLILSVNGIYYSYPSTVAWIIPSGSIPHERFPLPSAGQYQIAFRVISEGGGSGGSSEVQEISAFPAESQVYDLWNGETTRGISPSERPTEGSTGRFTPEGPDFHVRYSVR